MKLKDICTIVPGFAFKSADFGYGTSKAIKITDIQPPKVNLHDADNVSFTPDAKFKVECGDFVMAMTGATIGKIGLVEEATENVYINQRVCKFMVNESVNKAFVYYSLLQERFNRFIFANVDSSSAQPNIGHHTIGNYNIGLPDLPTQDAIASVLSSLDRKISLNRKANEVLESMAKQLYDYWFVQFDFPNAEGKPYKSSGGKMVYNETLKREIPEGWEVKQLAELLELSENGEWGQEEMDANTIDINCIRGADIVDLIGAPRRYLPNNKTSKLMQEHDIIVEISGGSPIQATGRCNYVTKEILGLYNGKLTCSNFCKFLRLADKEYAPYFFYLWSLFYENGNMFHYEGKTSGIKNLQIDNLLAEYWCVPPKNIAYRFFDICTDVNYKVGKNKKETLRLTSLRDYLLPLLMNGQVKVS